MLKPSSPRAWLVAIVGVFLLGTGLRISGATQDNRLQPDEALFAGLSRRMVVEGDFWLTYAAIDKPPTTFFVTGISLATLGDTEFSVRITNVFFSMLGLAGMVALTKTMVNRQAALLGLLLMALSPLEIRYAVSGFQDTPMLALLILATWQAGRLQWGRAGLLMGLAIIFKPTALWVMPLMVGLGLLRELVLVTHQAQRVKAVRFLRGLILPLLIIILWDWGRPQRFLQTGFANNNPGRWIRADEVIPRFNEWLAILASMTGTIWLAVCLGVLMVGWLVWSARRKPNLALVGWLITAYSLSYAGLHWLVAFNTYDRYFLPLLPFLAMLGATALACMVGKHVRRLGMVAIVLLGSGLMPAYQHAHEKRAPEQTGIEILGQTLTDEYGGRIIYDYWLGWELSWYLGAKSDVMVVYFSTAEDLGDHLQHETGERFFVAPSAQEAEPWRILMAARGVKTRQVYRTPQGNFVLYSLLPPRTALAELFG